MPEAAAGAAGDLIPAALMVMHVFLEINGYCVDASEVEATDIMWRDATLKGFFREKVGVRLEPANPEMAPIYVRSGKFRIPGKVVGVQRFLDSKRS